MSERTLAATYERFLHYAFEIGIYIKGIDGILETIGGFLFLFLKPQVLNGIVASLTEHEVIEDPQDVVANYLARTVQHLSLDTKIFGVLFLLTHGIVKILLAIGLLKNQVWAYLGAIGVFSVFLLYQLYRLSYHYTVGLTIITIIDIAVVALTWHEYHHVSRLAKNSSIEEVRI